MAALRPKYRLYVDEVGNHDLDVRRSKPAERYLSLTGLIVDLDYVRTTLSPAIEGLKSRLLALAASLSSIDRSTLPLSGRLAYAARRRKREGPGDESPGPLAIQW